MPITTTPPSNAAEMRAAVLERFDGLSDRLQQIARYLLAAPDDLALETLAVLAKRSGVQPSAIVRFAQAFGFEGASQMQRLFRDELVSNRGGYGERIRRSKAKESGAIPAPGALLDEFIEGNVAAVRSLARTIDDETMGRAVRIIAAADTVYVAGFRRSFPVSAYLAYLLIQAGKRTVLVDGVAGLAREQMHGIRACDALLVVTFHPSAEEATAVLEEAAARAASTIALTDSPVSPAARTARLALIVREAEVRNFRSLSASMCVVQSLAIAYAFHRGEQETDVPPPTT